MVIAFFGGTSLAGEILHVALLVELGPWQAAIILHGKIKAETAARAVP